jgi:glycosyltransferase involved in cell wall biosynthesis
MEVPFVSIIIPCRNEEKFISICLNSIIEQDYPKDKIEVLVVDGMSDDGTREIIEKHIRNSVSIRMFDNPGRIVPKALNIGIKNVRGEIIIRMDAHNIYEKDYISKCIKYLYEYKADNVGGIWITLPGTNTLVSRSIALSLSHPFGVGNAYFRTGLLTPRETDTVPFGCYRKEVFGKIGNFNENLVRNQDIEFNLRLKKAGGKVLLVPDIVSYYHARSTLKSLFRQNFLNGFWVLYSIRLGKLPFSLRHLIPFLFAVSLTGSLCLSFFSKFFSYLFAFIFCLYLSVNSFFSFKLSLKYGLKYFPALVASFAVLHISYGLGSLWGITRLIASRFQVNKSHGR